MNPIEWRKIHFFIFGWTSKGTQNRENVLPYWNLDQPKTKVQFIKDQPSNIPVKSFFLQMAQLSVNGRHHDLVDRYGISVSQMTTDMFHLS
jgi:hypothetical protein